MDRDGSHAPPPPDGTGDSPPEDRSLRAWRVTFSYEGDRVSVIAQQRVAMVSPPDDLELLERGRAGYWVEVRDTDGRPIYHQVLSRPIQTDYEVHSPDPTEAPRRVAAIDPRGVFQVVVPDRPDGHEIVLYGRPSAEEVETHKARQLVKARLHETPPPGGPVP